MELFALLGGLCVLGILAVWFGYDSRAGIPSQKHTLATFGFAWHGKPGALGHAGTVQSAHPLRHRIAVVLTALADWLYPVDSQPGGGIVSNGRWA